MKANLILGTVTVIFSVFFLFNAYQMQTRTSTGPIGAIEWPVIILYFMLTMGLLLIGNTLLHVKKGNKEQAAKEGEKEEKVSNRKYLHFYILIFLAVYIVLLPKLGFVIATPIFFFGLCWLFGLGSVIKVVGVTIVSNAAFIILFIYILDISFPRGAGIFRSLSYLIY